MDHSLYPVIEALIKNEGIQKICDAAAAALGNPFWVVDLNHKMLTTLSGGTANETLLSEQNIGFVSDDTLSYLKKNKIRDKINQADGPVIFKALNSDKHILTCAAKISGIAIAHISVIEENHAFTEQDYGKIQTIADIISTELQKNSFYKNNKDLMYSYFLADLIENHLYPQDIAIQIKKIGYKARSLFYLFTVELGSIEQRDMVVSNIKSQIQFLLKNCIFCTYKNCLIYLITVDRPFTESSPALLHLKEFLENSHLKAALSDSFTDLSSVPEYYQKNAEAIRLGKKSKPDGSLYNYSTLAMQHIIEITDGIVSYSDFCNHAISKLLLYDRDTNSELLNTLHVFLEHNASVVPASKALGIHSNTMRYRLDKIREVTGCNLENGREAFELHMALAIYNFQMKKKEPPLRR